jgi:very-short-patch-repair endonuclease
MAFRINKRMRGTTPELDEAALRLRRSMTPAEQVLWQALRNKQLCDIKFRRQHPLGRTILDFCAPSIRLVIEVDGEIHRYQQVEDAARTRNLEEYGYRVIRFTNEEVIGDLIGVLRKIESVIGELRVARGRSCEPAAPSAPPPKSSPEDGGGLEDMTL